RIQELLVLTDRVIRQRFDTRQLRLYQRIQKSTRSQSDKPLGQSAVWLDAMSMAQRLAKIPVGNRSINNDQASGGALTTILITGKTGVGKGVVARYIHNASDESERPFVHVNCTALPASLIESELFGHEKGAFTDAKITREGLFEMADGGTIFLDEIGDLDLPLQAKLLSVIEHGRIRKVGSAKERPIEMRVLAATNKDLSKMVKDGTFREDLLFRINAFTIDLPDLSSRGDDAILIAESMLNQLRSEYGLEVATLNDDAKAAISGHDWPGNVRELFNAIQRAAMLAPSPLITRHDIGIQSQDPKRQTEEGVAVAENGMRFNFASGVHIASKVEQELMIQALEHSNGNVSKAAKLIGMQRSSFRYRIERYGIDFVKTEAGGA
ncbi:MAG: sigma-54-dependent Fis family transcriptional regulator, partial [Phycisphaerales bacterium]|nr:sigma-54-dependent Fis family transcriptional regulator [Phycisphaerales bacterium]